MFDSPSIKEITLHSLFQTFMYSLMEWSSSMWNGYLSYKYTKSALKHDKAKHKI